MPAALVLAASAASIAGAGAGTGLLMAHAPGATGRLKANGAFETMLACTPTRVCDVLSGIDVLP